MAVWERLTVFLGLQVPVFFAEWGHEVWFKRIDAGTEAQRAGDYATARRKFEAALKIARLLGKRSPLYASSLMYLGLMLDEQGRYDEAAPFLEAALALLERQVGRGNPAFASQLLALANVYSEQGRHAEAEPLIVYAQDIFEALLGGDHPEVARALEAHAALCGRAGRADDARDMEARAARIRGDWERRYPPDAARQD